MVRELLTGTVEASDEIEARSGDDTHGGVYVILTALALEYPQIKRKRRSVES